MHVYEHEFNIKDNNKNDKVYVSSCGECGNEGSPMCIQATSIDTLDCAPYIWFFESRNDRVEAWEGHK